ncbi:hypothetical protein ACAW74_26325 [Fibrella sp. WM1]|uniref:hypothetical protein n=1 Tax=Fibrella musci TaxID=3242485 RepID=UPI0035219598
MKTTLTRLLGAYGLAALLISGLNACKGDQGDVGPAGPQGPKGDTGATGPQGVSGVTGPQGVSGAAGKDGNANVVYTDWKSMQTDAFGRASDNTVAYLNTNATAQTVLTQEAFDKGVVYVYYKFKYPFWDQSIAEYKLVDRINQGYAYNYSPIPGRPATSFENFVQTYIGNDFLGVNYFYPFIQIYTRDWNATTQKYTAMPEFVGKPATTFRDLVKDAPQYRIMVVYGSTKGGRMTNEGKPVDFNSYASVKAYFNLTD